MTRDELVIKLIRDFKPDDIVIIGDSKTGWSNIGEVKQDGCSIAIMFDITRVFSSDN